MKSLINHILNHNDILNHIVHMDFELLNDNVLPGLPNEYSNFENTNSLVFRVVKNTQQDDSLNVQTGMGKSYFILEHFVQ